MIWETIGSAPGEIEKILLGRNSETFICRVTFDGVSGLHPADESILVKSKCEPIRKLVLSIHMIPDSKVHGAKMGHIWSRQDSGGPHVGPMNFAIWNAYLCMCEF